MATQILPIASVAASSGEVIIAAGANLAVSLFFADGGRGLRGSPAIMTNIMMKDPAGNFVRVAQLSGAQNARVITAAGTYRFDRIAGFNVGVFSG